MGSKHPLDVFRSSGEGFDRASRGSRRTLAGKVIASSVKKTTPRKVPLSSGRPPRARGLWPFGGRSNVPKAGRPPKAPKSKPARTAESRGRALLYGAVTLVALVALVVAVKQTWRGSPGDLPSLKASDVLTDPNAPPPPAAPPPAFFTILASTYNGSDRGREQALAAQEELLRRFFRQVTVVGYPEPGKKDRFQRFELLVGQAPRADDLSSELARLRAIDDWDGGKAAPFVSATIEGYPALDG